MVEKGKGSIKEIGLCPFSWIQVSKPAGCLSSKEQIVTEPQPCMTTRCKLWNSSQDNCGLITKGK